MLFGAICVLVAIALAMAVGIGIWNGTFTSDTLDLAVLISFVCIALLGFGVLNVILHLVL